MDIPNFQGNAAVNYTDRETPWTRIIEHKWFEFGKNEDGNEDIRLIDWEYAGMQDPHVDIAMFCIYSMYDREHVDKLIDAYFTEGVQLKPE